MKKIAVILLLSSLLVACGEKSDEDVENNIIMQEEPSVFSEKYVERDLNEEIVEAFVEEPESLIEEENVEGKERPTVVIKTPEAISGDVPEDDFVLEPVAEIITNGRQYQVSTIIGTGVAHQSSSTLSYPLYTQVASNGDVYFVDGDLSQQKIRKLRNGTLETVFDLTNNKLNRSGQFSTTGMVHIGKNLLMVSNPTDIFYIDGDSMHRVPGDVPKYMEEHRLERIWLMKAQGERLYLLFKLKGHNHTYHLAEYRIDTNTLVPILDRTDFVQPFSFYVADNNIYTATAMGYIERDQLFPRQKTAYYRAEDAKVNILDIWMTQDDMLMFSLTDGTYSWIMKERAEDFVTVAGAQRGYQDGVLDEIMMDTPMSFAYDGTGYLFSDRGNNVLRKFWTTDRPK